MACCQACADHEHQTGTPTSCQGGVCGVKPAGDVNSDLLTAEQRLPIRTPTRGNPVTNGWTPNQAVQSKYGSQPFYKNPWVIGGGIAILAAGGIATWAAMRSR